MKKLDTNKLKKLNPTFIGLVDGISFLEDPIMGDEAPLILKYKGEYYSTDFWDLPDKYDVAESLTELLDLVYEGEKK